MPRYFGLLSLLSTIFVLFMASNTAFTGYAAPAGPSPGIQLAAPTPTPFPDCADISFTVTYQDSDGSTKTILSHASNKYLVPINTDLTFNIMVGPRLLGSEVNFNAQNPYMTLDLASVSDSGSITAGPGGTSFKIKWQAPNDGRLSFVAQVNHAGAGKLSTVLAQVSAGRCSAKMELVGKGGGPGPDPTPTPTPTPTMIPGPCPAIFFNITYIDPVSGQRVDLVDAASGVFDVPVNTPLTFRIRAANAGQIVFNGQNPNFELIGGTVSDNGSVAPAGAGTNFKITWPAGNDGDVSFQAKVIATGKLITLRVDTADANCSAKIEIRGV